MTDPVAKKHPAIIKTNEELRREEEDARSKREDARREQETALSAAQVQLQDEQTKLLAVQAELLAKQFARDQQMIRFSKWSALAGVVGIAVAALTLVAVAVQTWQSVKSTDAAQLSARAAIEAVAEGRESRRATLADAEESRRVAQAEAERSRIANLGSLNKTLALARNEQRAWISVLDIELLEAPQVGQNIFAQARFINTGKTPARNMITAGSVFVRGDFKDFKSPGLPKGTPDSKAVLAPGALFFSLLDMDQAIPSTGHLDAINQLKTSIYVRGTIKYTDVFADSHLTEYCFRSVAKSRDGKFAFSPCPAGNDLN